MVARFSSDDAEFVRNEAVIEHSSVDEYFLLLLVLRGEALGFLDDSEFELKCGDICVLDLSKRARLRIHDCELTGILIRRDVLCGVETDLHGRMLTNGRLGCRMLTDHLERLIELLSSTAAPRYDALVDATIAVIRNCLHITQLKAEGAQPWLDMLRCRILDYIEKHLTEVDLDATRIRQVFRISRAHLYRLFPGYGGIQRYIRTRRLDFAFRSLRETPSRRISWVAEHSGFTNERQFQRAFLKRFEMTPRELRQKHRARSRGEETRVH
jgi:AraC-like DNA-binding protein